MASTLPPSQSATTLSGPGSVPARRLPPTATNKSATNLSVPQSATMHNLNTAGGHKQMHSSRTWTTSSGELGLMSDTDEVEDRALFLQEYNRLAKKHGMRLLVVDDFKLERPLPNTPNPPKRSWISRLFRSSSVSHSSRPAALHKPTAAQPLPTQPQMRQRRSVSDIAHHVVHTKREPPKVLDLQTMVRLSGKSQLYLPSDFAPGTLVLPTCIRATAQHLAQHTTVSGIFRIPGSVRLVNALFDYYCYMEKRGVDVSNTVHCASLPMHIRASVHDVASTFKRLLSVLPGGILGTLSLFDAFVAIHSLLRGDPEFPRTKQTKVRARFIALAIGTIQSQFRRELICAVFGLLSLIGRAAEVAPREDENRRPLPTGDLMGYSALGIVFGPLLVGDLLEQYTMNLATPNAGLLVFPLSSPKKLQKGHKRRKSSVSEKPPSREVKTVDKIFIANSITEMLIVNWRDIVRQMKSLGTHHRKADSTLLASGGSLRPSISESFIGRQPRDWERGRRESAVQVNRDGSPEPGVQPMGAVRQRPKSKKSVGSNKLRPKQSGTMLSPTVEESSTEEASPYQRKKSSNPLYKPEPRAPAWSKDDGAPIFTNTPTRPATRMSVGEGTIYDEDEESPSAQRRRQSTRQSTHEHEVSWEDVPPRTSSKQRGYFDTSMVSQSTQAEDKERPVIRNFHEYNQNQAEAMADTHRHSSTAPRPRDSLISQGSQASYISASKAVEANLNSPRRDLNTDEFENMQTLSKELSESPMTKNQTPSSRRDTRSSYQSRASQAENDIFYASHTGETDHRYPSSQRSEPIRSPSIEVTPTHFYAAMKVPPSLAGEEQATTTRPSTTKVSPTDTTDQTPTRKTLASVFNKPQADDGDRAKGAKQIKGSLTADRLSRFEQMSKGIAPKSQLIEVPKAKKASEAKAKQSSSVRTTESDAKSRRVGVRAIAARFEEHKEPLKSAGSRPKSGNRVLSTYTQSSPAKTVRESKSGSLWGDQTSPAKTSWSTKAPSSVTRPSITDTTNRDVFETPKLRTSVSDSVALRAAAFMQAEKQQQGPSTERLPLAGLRQTQEQPKTSQTPDTSQQENQNQGIVNLGSWGPHQEQPPVATHLNLARPTSSASKSQQRVHDLVSEDSAIPIQRPRSTTSLHTQIRNFQRQLDTKTEEAAQLRRQLEAQEDSDVRTLSEQLREAKRESQMWKDRAEAAERRVKVFERFTARLKGIRNAAASADEQTPSQEGSEGSLEGDEEASPNQQVRFLEGKVVDRRTESADSGHTEDAGVVTARIRRCSHGSQGTHDSVDEEGLPVGLDGTVDSREIQEIWMAAERELLRDEGRR